MIKIIRTLNKIAVRANGWTQDASDFTNLWRLCNAFDTKAPFHEDACNNVKKFVHSEGMKKKFLNLLEANDTKFTYLDIVGKHKSGTSRKTSTICNGIGQATMRGQKDNFLRDWPTDNFLRWAVLLGFVDYNIESDKYCITSAGKEFAEETDVTKRNSKLKTALKHYPPVRRVIRLLKEHQNGLTKFELGEQLGCIGEKGFTNIGQDLFEKLYQSCDNSDKKKLLANKEGSSDKYARQICSWLTKLNLICSRRVADKSKPPIKIYRLTASGLEFERELKISNNVFVIFSMLSMDGKRAPFLMKRRALILYYVQNKKLNNISSIIEKLKTDQIPAVETTITDDIKSMYRCGINITVTDSLICLKDNIYGLQIPINVEYVSNKLIEQEKNYISSRLMHIDHDYLKLIELSREGKENSSWFENYSYKVYHTFCTNVHLLGGAKRPDIIAEYGELGLIIDAKAYKNGFSANQQSRDEMERYVNEADKNVKNTKPAWTNYFSPNVKCYIFQFVSSSFCQKIQSKLKDISDHTFSREEGTAITAGNLLLLAEKAQIKKIPQDLFKGNKEIKRETICAL